MSIYKWRINCQTHGNQNIWSPIKPTTCPINEVDTINDNLTTVVDKIVQGTVAIKDDYGTTGGNFKAESRYLEIPPNSTESFNTSWLYPVKVTVAYIMSTAENKDDLIDVIIAPNATIGAITAPILIGATSCTVNQTVIDFLCVGYKMKLTDGVNTNDVGTVGAIDTTTKVVTFTTPTTNSFSPLTPTYVQMSIYLVENMKIGPPGRYDIGQGKIGGSFIPPTIVSRVSYTNLSATDTKKFYCYIEYLY